MKVFKKEGLDHIGNDKEKTGIKRDKTAHHDYARCGDCSGRT